MNGCPLCQDKGYVTAYTTGDELPYAEPCECSDLTEEALLDLLWREA